MKRAAFALIGSLIAMPALGEPSFIQPIDCALGKTCYIQHYVDQDPSSGYRDFACDALTYDGHKGTDFGVFGSVDINTYFRGFDVLAAADGTVLGTRNSMPDKSHPSERIDASGKDCGNGLVIDHGGGWQTQYCHMKYQSLRVKSGQQVKAGEVLGQVGLSGVTEFRHLHFSVRKDGQVVDPFNRDAASTCGVDAKQMWQTPMPHVPTGLIAVGVSNAVPKYQDLIALPMTESDWDHQPPALVLWALGFGSDAGDSLHLSVRGPKGTLFETTITLEKEQSRYYRAYGKKRPTQGWPSGQYVGTVTIHRQNKVAAQDTVQFTLP